MESDHLSGGSKSPGMHRKRKRNGERARVTRACDRCKRRKVRCNGTKPCDICIVAETQCTFESAYTRGRVPEIEDKTATEDDEIRSTAVPPEASSAAISQVASGNSSLQIEGLNATATVDMTQQPGYDKPASQPLSSQEDSPEPLQTDLQGHYIGPASGVSFLLRIQKRLHQSISFSPTSTIFTFGDAPINLPEFEPSFCMMLPRDNAQQLLDRYFSFAMPTYRFLHQPTVQLWFDEFYDTLGIMNDAQSAPAKVALLFMVFAHARVYMPADNKPGPEELSTRYFLAAEHQLKQERGSICLTSVQARLTQCYYLLTQSRINHCWSLFGTVSHLALAIGLNRNRKPHAASGISVIEAQGRRRTFWCAYTLDAYLSVVLGRPRSFHDDDIDTELPACVDDIEITSDAIRKPVSRTSPSTMLAPIAHIKLARILSKIVRDLYGIKPISSSRRGLVTDRISKDLSDWRVELTHFLDVASFSSSALGPIYERQRNVLNLTYWHAIILTYRPFILSNLAQLTRQSSSAHTSHNFGSDPDVNESVKQCLSAAMSTARTVDDIASGSHFFGSFWITAYFAFTATIVLYIYVIQKRASPPETFSEYFVAATRCQSHLSSIAEAGSLSQRYCLILEELRLEALRQVRRMNPGLGTSNGREGQSYAHPTDGNVQSNQLGTDTALAMDPAALDAAIAMGMFDNSPSAATNYTDMLMEDAANLTRAGLSFQTADYSGWDQFANMVASGFGNLDDFL